MEILKFVCRTPGFCRTQFEYHCLGGIRGLDRLAEAAILVRSLREGSVRDTSQGAVHTSGALTQPLVIIDQTEQQNMALTTSGKL